MVTKITIALIQCFVHIVVILYVYIAFAFYFSNLLQYFGSVGTNHY
jgi:hypothetical protein